MARFRLIPREGKFFADFLAMADEILVAARLLDEMFAAEPPVWDKADEIKEIEHKCDFLTHEVFQRLHRTFVTPIDREDIHAMARALDDVMDNIDASAGLVRTYRIEKTGIGGRDLTRIILVQAQQLHQAAEGLELRKGVSQNLVEINRLENEADRVHQQAVKQLFEEARDPIAVMKWKEVLDSLEDTTDRCEDVADLIEGVILKHA